MTPDRIESFLPAEVVCRRRALAEGGVTYVLHHADLGELGCVCVRLTGLHAHVEMQPAPSDDANLATRRRNILRPIAQEIAAIVGESLHE